MLEVAAWEPESLLIESPEVAQAERSDATTRTRTALSDAKRCFTRRTYLWRCLMQGAVSGRFCSEEGGQVRSQISYSQRASGAAPEPGRTLISRGPDHRLAVQKARRHDRRNDQLAAAIAQAPFGDVFSWQDRRHTSAWRARHDDEISFSFSRRKFD